MKIDSLEKLLIHELKDLYSAESQFREALPKMADAASNKELREAFLEHLNETEGQIARLDQVFEHFDFEPSGEHCEAGEGLVAEGEEAIEDIEEGPIRDAALIAVGQRVEHYEMAGYGTAVALATKLGKSEVAELLTETLEEEGQADRELTRISERAIIDEALNAA